MPIKDPAATLNKVASRAMVINLLVELKERLGLTLIFISHDLAVVEHISDRIAVMYAGKIVEIAKAHELLDAPKHPYTEALISAVPSPDPTIRGNRIPLGGEVPNPAALPSGCPFHPRCQYARDECARDVPVVREVSQGHQVACLRAEDFTLAGIKTAKQ